MAEAVKVLEAVNERFALGLALEYGLLGGTAIDAHGVPLPDETLARAREVDAILLGAVGAEAAVRIHGWATGRSYSPEAARQQLLEIRTSVTEVAENVFVSMMSAPASRY